MTGTYREAGWIGKIILVVVVTLLFAAALDAYIVLNNAFLTSHAP